MRIHFFTASSFMSFFTPGSKKQEEKGILPPFPPKIGFLKLSCHIHMCLLLPMVFVQVEANRNQKHFHFH